MGKLTSYSCGFSIIEGFQEKIKLSFVQGDVRTPWAWYWTETGSKKGGDPRILSETKFSEEGLKDLDWMYSLEKTEGEIMYFSLIYFTSFYCISNLNDSFTIKRKILSKGKSNCSQLYNGFNSQEGLF